VATEHELRDRMLLCSKLLAAIDPESDAIRQILAEAGYSFSCGRWQSRESRVRLVWDVYQEHIAAEACSVGARLALKVNVSDGGTEREVPLTCSMASSKGRLTVVSLSPIDEAFSASVKVSFVPLLRPLIAEHRRLGASLNRVLREIRKNAVFEAQVEIREVREEVALGFVLRLEDRKWIVDRVLAGGAADRGWVEADDELLAIDGVALSDSMSPDDVQERLSVGPDGTAVRLELRRRGQVFVVELTPEEQIRVTLESRFRIVHNLSSNYELQASPWHELPSIQEAP